MGMNVEHTRALYESYVGKQDAAGKRVQDPKGRTRFVNTIRHMLGVCDENGSHYTKRNGARCLRESYKDKNGTHEVVDPSRFNMQELALSIVGPSYHNYFDPDKRDSLRGLLGFNQHAGTFGEERALYEASGVGVDVTAFADINAWTGVTGGLLERKILEGFEDPDFIGEKIMPIEPTKINAGQKVIGVTELGDVAQLRQPGMPHVRALVGERFITLGTARENALAVDVTKEAAFFDLTGQLMERAQAVGRAIAYRREVDMLSAFIGVTTQLAGKYQFIYDNTAYSMYSSVGQTIGGTYTLINAQSNVLYDWESLQASWLLFTKMVNPDTGVRYLINPDDVLVSPARMSRAMLIKTGEGIQRRTGNVAGVPASQSLATDLNVQNSPDNPATQFGIKNIYWSTIVDQILTNPTTATPTPGLGLSQADADNRWWHFNSKKRPPFKYMQIMPMTVRMAPADNYEMLDRGLISSAFASERGLPAAWSPWSVVQNQT